MHFEAVMLYQVHYIGRVEYEQYRAEYTALWHAELIGRRCWVLPWCDVGAGTGTMWTTQVLSRSAQMTSTGGEVE